MERRPVTRIAIVTGGLGAVGRAVCSRLRTQGWVVAAIDAAAQTGTELADPVPNNHYFGADLRDSESLQDAARRIRALRMPIGALVNVAGGFRWELVGGGSLATWDALYETNVRTAVNACQTFLSDLLDAAPASIVNVGAAAAGRAAAGMGPYAAAKSGVLRLTEALAEELKHKAVTVNALLPSIVDTPANRKDMPDADPARWVSPASIAALAAFLLSPEARDITGAAIPVVGRV